MLDCRRRIAIPGLTLLILSGCISAEYRQHVESGNAAVVQGDYEACISEMKAAIAIDADVGSIPYRALGYCYQQLGRSQESWSAIRQAVLTNPISRDQPQKLRWKFPLRLYLGSTQYGTRRHTHPHGSPRGGPEVVSESANDPP